ncbi:MAG TPA: hypothetical protein DCY54_05745 [Parachlamydiales bacterium]|nr:MAG: hypothetical protein A3E26_06055 [Chlamydiae bacterium RIFCSPHIGHO2_12_FULL_49_32]HAZ16116.1 hypothetical protein [Parachlamydiales bacterium]HCJ82886.1 hypothetical protein [Parachlamydiales bacterium]
MKKNIIFLILIFQGVIFADDRQTSITDEASYRSFCREAAQNESVFLKFKQHPELIRVMQHVSVMQGKELIAYV